MKREVLTTPTLQTLLAALTGGRGRKWNGEGWRDPHREARRSARALAVAEGRALRLEDAPAQS